MIRNTLRAAAVALLFVAPALPAQIWWGATAGLAMSKFTGDDATDVVNRMGGVVGVVLQKHKEGSNLFWESGAAFAMRGSGFEASGAEGHTAINYVEIPVMAGWKFSKAGRKMTPFVTGGVVVGLKMSCDSEVTFSGSTSTSDCGDDVTGLDTPISIGGGISQAGANATIVVAVLYNMGLATIDKPASGTAGDIKSSSITLKVAYMKQKKPRM